MRQRNREGDHLELRAMYKEPCITALTKAQRMIVQVKKIRLDFSWFRPLKKKKSYEQQDQKFCLKLAQTSQNSLPNAYTSSLRKVY